MRATEEQHNARKREMMEKCFECYAENGLTGTGIKALAAACGCTTGNLYSYFNSVDELIIESTAYCMEKVEDDFMEMAPTDPKTDVVYLALEDREWRVQQRMQDLTDTPPDNLHFGFSCGQLGAELESQIEDVLKDYPSTGLLFIDTLQMVRDNASAKVNAYAQDYKDLSSLKRIADNHGICIFVVHHTRKERDGGNIFNDMTGSTGIMGVADTGMILRKDDRFGDNATLCITGRDVEEKKLKMQMCGVKWEITEELSADDLRKERIPDFVFKVVDFLFEHKQFQGTVSELLAAVGNTELKPNVASKYLTRFYSEVFAPMGITYESLMLIEHLEKCKKNTQERY